MQIFVRFVLRRVIDYTVLESIRTPVIQFFRVPNIKRRVNHANDYAYSLFNRYVYIQKPYTLVLRTRNAHDVYLCVHARGNDYTSKGGLSLKRSDSAVIGIPLAGSLYAKTTGVSSAKTYNQNPIPQVPRQGITLRGTPESKRERVALR
jgi:hypothetical protein